MFGYRVLVGLIAIGLLLLLTLVVLAAQRVAADTFWIEAGKVAMSGIAAAFFSLVIGRWVKLRDERRDDDRALLEYRRRFLLDAVEAYGRVKAARRALRAKGLGPDGPQSLNTAHIADLHLEVARLSDAQLTFMRQWRELSARKAFSKQHELMTALSTIKDYLSSIITEWETGTPLLQDGGTAAELHRWPHLRAFLLKEAHPEGDFEVVSDALDDMEEAVWADVLPHSAPAAWSSTPRS